MQHNQCTMYYVDYDYPGTVAMELMSKAFLSIE